MYKDGYEWLKPYCLDKWKKYINERKVFSYHFKKTQKYLNSRNLGPVNAFDQWKTAVRK